METFRGWWNMELGILHGGPGHGDVRVLRHCPGRGHGRGTQQPPGAFYLNKSPILDKPAGWGMRLIAYPRTRRRPIILRGTATARRTYSLRTATVEIMPVL